MKSSARGITGVVAALAVSAGCAGLQAEDGESVRHDSVVVHVENQNWNQATIYAEDGSRDRLGQVSGNSDAYFDARLPIGRSIAFEIRLLAGGVHRTTAIATFPGDTVVVRIPPTVR